MSILGTRVVRTEDPLFLTPAGIVVRATATEDALARGASIAEAAALADEGTSPVGDMHADEVYRRHLARLLTRRALESAA